MANPSTELTIQETLPPLIRALLTDPACYDHPVEKIKLIETHISWVLLTGLYAYKIKKPVNLGFLDFSTLQLRQQDCVEELRLNRRLAADIYLDVVAISGSIDAPRINGAGGVLEYAVKMRQFPSDATMDHLAERGELGNMQIDALAARLAHFHLFECEPAPADSLWGEPDTIARPVAENFQLLSSRLEDQAECQLLAQLQSWCLAEHARLASLMRERKRDGRVRECHGDLHLANLAWVDGQLVIFDCLEFNPALRWIDVISEVAFCYMDLLQKSHYFLHAEVLPSQGRGDDRFLPFRGRIEAGVGQHPGLAQRFLNAWLETSGDYQGVALLRYYAVYRALVRAKVAALRADQGCSASRAEVSSCLQLAEQLACIPSPFSLSRNNLGHSPLVVRGMPLHSATGAFAPSLRGNALHSGIGGLSPYIPWEDPCGLAALRHHPSPFSLPPSLYITHGLSGSGKTTLSQTLLEKRGMIRLRSDVERKRLAGLDALANEHGKDAAIDDETIHARSPLLNPLPLAGEEVNESLREFQVKSGGDIGDGLYSLDSSRRTYQHLANLTESLLAAGWPVVVDAAFLERDQRDLFRDLAKRLGVNFQILDIQADPATLRERVRQRQAAGCDASEADLRVLQLQLATAQPLGADELDVVTRLSAVSGLTELI